MQIFMPSGYIQEKGALQQIATYFKHLMDQGVLIIMDGFSFQSLKDQVLESFIREGTTFAIEILDGECCEENIRKMIGSANGCGARCVMGVGGGKVLDVAKAVGHFGGMKTLMVPTVASTDGPCSKLSVLYEADGTFKEYLYLKGNPDGVLVDTQIIASAPVRFLKAGIGDALSTYFETEAGYLGELERTGQSTISQTARALSKACFEIIRREGEQALKAVERKEVDEHLEAVVEAIIYLSCGGFENGSLAAAHGVANALSSKAEYQHVLHGEKVAFGTIVQLILEGQPVAVVKDVVDFCKRIDLPYAISSLGIDVSQLEELAQLSCKPNQPIHKMRRAFIDAKAVRRAMELTEKYVL